MQPVRIIIGETPVVITSSDDDKITITAPETPEGQKTITDVRGALSTNFFQYTHPKENPAVPCYEVSISTSGLRRQNVGVKKIDASPDRVVEALEQLALEKCDLLTKHAMHESRLHPDVCPHHQRMALIDAHTRHFTGAVLAPDSRDSHKRHALLAELALVGPHEGRSV